MHLLAFKNSISYIVIGFCFLFAGSSFILLPSFQHWHDQQRVAQIILCAVCALMMHFISIPSLPKWAKFSLLSIFVLGGISAVFAHYPIWAFYEWSIFLGLFFLAAVIRSTSVSQAKFGDYILAILAFATVVNSVQFIAAYLTAVFSGLHNFSASFLYSGFSNPRFLNQFQALALPVLGYVFLTYRKRSFPYARLLVTCILISLIAQWVIAFTLGGRGLWLALAISHFMLIVFFPRYWRLLAVQLIAGLTAWVLYYLMFIVIPECLEVTPFLWDNLRTGLSMREVVWTLALDVFKDHPWLGVGPMHFSSYVNPVAAHPHQAILQWLAEWGLLATIMAVILVVAGMIFGLKYVRQKRSNHLDAALWMSLLNAFILAQVDGVFVMPYTATWLAILIGLAWTKWSSGKEAVFFLEKMLWRLAAIFTLVLCFNIVFVETYSYLEANKSLVEQQNDFAPRFWSKGFIAR